MSKKLALVALCIGILVEVFLYGHRAGPGWLVLTAAVLCAAVHLQKVRERPAALWTWLLWIWPFSAALAVVTYDAEAVHVLGPVVCISGLLVSTYWSVVGPVPVERFAQPAPAHFWWGLVRLLPESVAGVRTIRPNIDGGLSRRVALGISLSVPLLLLFGGLLCADQPFQDFLATHFDGLRLDWVPQAVRVALFSALALGWLRALAHQDTQAPEPLPDAGQWDPLVLAIPIGLLNALFATFLVVQAEYLFGGVRYASRPNLPYATYLHQGYFELVAVTILALVVVGAVYRFSYRQEGGLWPLALSGVLIVQCFGIAASAWQRFEIYTQAYGLTVLRIYAELGLGVACALLVLVLYGIVRRRSLAWLSSRMALAVALSMAVVMGVDVDGWIARVNVPAIVAHRIPADYSYLASLSTDCVPAMVSVPEMQETVRTLTGRAQGPWQEWNVSRWRALHESP